MRTGTFDIQPAHQGDVESYLRLMNLGDFRRKKTAAYFSWFYFNGPRETLLLRAADPSGRPAGQMGLQLRELPGMRAGMIVDMVVAPDFRGRGVFREMESEAARIALARGAAALTSFTNPMGERALLRLGYWHRATQITTLEWTGSAAEPLTSGSHAPRSQFLGFSRLDAEWRFRQHPEYTYRHWTEGRGTLWTKDFKDQTTGRTFTDLVSVGGVELTPPALLGAAVQDLRAGGASVLTAWALPGVPDAAALSQLGFRPGDQQRSLCVRWLTPEAESRFQTANWALCQADTEVF